MEEVTKKDIRDRVLAVRDAMTVEEWRQKSRQIRRNLMGLSVFDRAAHILSYVNYRREADTEELIRMCLAKGVHVYCPLVDGKSMEFYEIYAAEELQKGFQGILEPPARKECLFAPYGRETDTLMVMPGAVFDRAHHRIGYGGGYYDRYLQRVPDIATAALAFSFQVRESIPYAPHDIRPQIIVTETGEI